MIGGRRIEFCDVFITLTVFEVDRFSDLEVALMKVKKRNIKIVDI